MESTQQVTTQEEKKEEEPTVQTVQQTQQQDEEEKKDDQQNALPEPQEGVEIAPYKVNPDGSYQYYPDIEQRNFTEIYAEKTEFFETPQSEATTETLKQLMDQDNYNAYCIDCKKNTADHATLTFGLYICGDCAIKHREQLGMNQSYVKSIFNENWDEYQLKFLQHGGNKAYLDFIKYYCLENEQDIKKKYTHRGSIWWSNKLRAKVDGTEFNYKQPAQNELVMKAQGLLNQGVGKTKEILGAGKDKTVDLLHSGKDKTVEILSSGAEKSKEMLSQGAEKSKELLYAGADKSKELLISGKDKITETGSALASKVGEGLTSGSAWAKGKLSGFWGGSKTEDTKKEEK